MSNVADASQPPIPRRFIQLDGRLYLWREVVAIRRQQLASEAKAAQPTLFNLFRDIRPALHRAAAGRYAEPSLFDA